MDRALSMLEEFQMRHKRFVKKVSEREERERDARVL